MCIRVRYAPRQLLDDPYDSAHGVITLPEGLHQQYALRALRIVLLELGVAQPPFGARCWCGEQVRLLPLIPHQRRSDEVINLGA
jgi:hypothetical protein